MRLRQMMDAAAVHRERFAKPDPFAEIAAGQAAAFWRTAQDGSEGPVVPTDVTAQGEAGAGASYEGDGGASAPATVPTDVTAEGEAGAGADYGGGGDGGALPGSTPEGQGGIGHM